MAMNGGWQPIATAPKDGRNVWVAYRSECGHVMQTEAWWCVSEWQTADGCYSIDEVAFWMPMQRPKEKRCSIS